MRSIRTLDILNKAVVQICLLLVVALPISSSLASAQFFLIGSETHDLGEAIAIEVIDYEPAVLKSQLIEERNVPIYVHLRAITPGEFLFGEEGPEYEPFISKPSIKAVKIIPSPETMRYVTFPKFVPPAVKENWRLDNFGYLILVLKRIRNESAVPDRLDLNFTARVYFDFTRGFGDVNMVDLVLKQMPDEETWKRERANYESFWNGKGYLRLISTRGSTATIQLYGSGMNYLFLPAKPGEEQVNKGVFTITEGETVTLSLPGTSPFFGDRFRLKLNRISSPERKALLEINTLGKVKIMELSKGMPIAYDSEWYVADIEENSVVLKDGHGNIATLTLKTKESTEKISEVTKDNINYYESTLCKDYEKDSLETTFGNLTNKPESEDAIRALCMAIRYAKASISDNQKLNDLAYKFIGDAYYQMADYLKQLHKDEQALRDSEGVARGLALHYYQLVISRSPEISRKIDVLRENLFARASEPAYLENENRAVKLLYIEEVAAAERTQAKIKLVSPGGVEKEKMTFEDETIVSGVDNSKNKRFYWKISQIGDGFIVVEKCYEGKKTCGESRQINKGEWRELETQFDKDGNIVSKTRIFLTETRVHKEAFVSIFPGGGEEVYATTSFMVHIPIEKRLIKFTPEEIKDMIEKTQKQIDKIEKYITQLEKIIKTWTQLCFATFGALVVKNALIGGPTKHIARKEVVPYYKKLCEKEVDLGSYATFDDCMMHYSKEINNAVSETSEAIEEGKEWIKNEEYLREKELNELGVTKENWNKFRNLYEVAGVSLPIDEETLKEWKIYCSLKDKSDLKEYRDYATAKCRELNETISNKVGAYSRVLGVLRDDEKNKLINKDSFRRLPQSEKTELVSRFVSLRDIALGGLEKEEINVDYIESELKSKLNREVNVELLPIISETSKGIKGYDKDLRPKDLIKICIKDGEEYDVGKSECTTPLLIGGYTIYKDKDKDGNNYYISAQEKRISDIGIRNSYAKHPNIEFDEKGRPYCLPAGKDGNYYRITAYTTTGDPQYGAFELWNVGPDGLLCTEDDILLKDPSRAAKEDYQQVLSLTRMVLAKGRCKEGGFIVIGSTKFWCSERARQHERMLTSAKCYDIMDPEDCRVLFGVCDPVLCPPSRFNLGGNWPLGPDESVVEKGIVGSVVLGLHNFNIPYEPLPVCLPGILAGLKNIKSLLEGYVSCLHTALIKNENIGICDKIRSIGVCELLWRELVNIYKLRGSIANIVAEKIFGKDYEGGGEYLNFLDTVNYVSDSVKYFTKEYSSSFFAAYKGRTTQEIGTEICKQAIFGKGFEVGDFIEQLSEPENPPQFFAMVDETPWAVKVSETYLPELGMQQYPQSAYSVYYHIYAGTVPEFARKGEAREGIRYAVHLTDGYRFLPVTTSNPSVVYKTISYGDYVDENIETFGPSGLNQICVEINGKRECGFGKVSTDFSVQYISDLIQKDELGRKINSMEECIPDASRTTPTLGSLILPRQYGMFSTGIVRTCSAVNPGLGRGEEHYWKVVGTCGQDPQTKRSLGYCWLDTRTITIHDLERYKTVKANVYITHENITKWEQLSEEEFKKYLGPEQSRTYLEILNEDFEKCTDTECYETLIIGNPTREDLKTDIFTVNYNILDDYSLDPIVSINAKLKIAEGLIKSVIIAVPLSTTSPSETHQIEKGAEGGGEKPPSKPPENEQEIETSSDLIRKLYQEHVKGAYTQFIGKPYDCADFAITLLKSFTDKYHLNLKLYNDKNNKWYSGELKSLKEAIASNHLFNINNTYPIEDMGVGDLYIAKRGVKGNYGDVIVRVNETTCAKGNMQSENAQQKPLPVEIVGCPDKDPTYQKRGWNFSSIIQIPSNYKATKGYIIIVNPKSQEFGGVVWKNVQHIIKWEIQRTIRNNKGEIIGTIYKIKDPTISCYKIDADEHKCNLLEPVLECYTKTSWLRRAFNRQLCLPCPKEESGCGKLDSKARAECSICAKSIQYPSIEKYINLNAKGPITYFPLSDPPNNNTKFKITLQIEVVNKKENDGVKDVEFKVLNNFNPDKFSLVPGGSVTLEGYGRRIRITLLELRKGFQLKIETISSDCRYVKRGLVGTTPEECNEMDLKGKTEGGNAIIIEDCYLPSYTSCEPCPNDCSKLKIPLECEQCIGCEWKDGKCKEKEEK